jgi:hypothetical protein
MTDYNPTTVADFSKLGVAVNDFGFSVHAADEFVELQKLAETESVVAQTTQTAEEYRMQWEAERATSEALRHKLKEVKALILPLLQNLVDTADMELIRWPNRRETVQPRIDALLKLTEG